MLLHDQGTLRMFCHTRNSTMPLTWCKNLTTQVRIFIWQPVLFLNIPLDLYPCLSTSFCYCWETVSGFSLFKIQRFSFFISRNFSVWINATSVTSPGMSNPQQWEQQYNWCTDIVSILHVKRYRLQESFGVYVPLGDLCNSYRLQHIWE